MSKTITLWFIIILMAGACDKNKTLPSSARTYGSGPSGADADAVAAMASVSVLLDETNIPACTPVLRGKVYYIASTGSFQYCNGSGWVKLPGVVGASGSPGVTMLVAANPEPKGDKCAEGGQKLRSGYDLSGDGALSDGEVTTTAYLCNGMPGILGLVGTSSFISMTELPNGTTPGALGAKCPAGGQWLKIGNDTNRNGVFDSSEIQTQANICNGIDGYSIVSRVTDIILPSSDCPTGGSKIELSRDLQRDGSQVPPIQTTYICDGAAGAAGSSGSAGSNGADGSSGNNGTNGANLLTKIQPLAANEIGANGAACVAGGIWLKLGLDINADTILQDPDEVQTQANICNGTTAPAAGTAIPDPPTGGSSSSDSGSSSSG